jgi:hypothetical protein
MTRRTLINTLRYCPESPFFASGEVRLFKNKLSRETTRTKVYEIVLQNLLRPVFEEIQEMPDALE